MIDHLGTKKQKFIEEWVTAPPWQVEQGLFKKLAIGVKNKVKKYAFSPIKRLLWGKEETIPVEQEQE